MPVGGGLVRLADPQDQRVGVPRADDLQPDRQPGGGEPARHAQRGLLGQVERVGVRRPARPARRRPAVRHVLPGRERGERKGRGEQQVVASGGTGPSAAELHPHCRRVEVVEPRSTSPRRGDPPQSRVDAVVDRRRHTPAAPWPRPANHSTWNASTGSANPGSTSLDFARRRRRALDRGSHRGVDLGVVADESESGAEARSAARRRRRRGRRGTTPVGVGMRRPVAGVGAGDHVEQQRARPSTVRVIGPTCDERAERARRVDAGPARRWASARRCR